jgi:3-oxoacyl-[acyl-carrier protein] reductase
LQEEDDLIMDYGLKGKKAVVCGASAGIGFGAAIKLASEGSDVILVSRSEQHLMQAAKKIKDVTGNECSLFACDISRAPDIDKLSAYISSKSGRVDMLVNNVGGPEPMPFMKVSDETWYTYFETLFMSVVRLTRSFVQLMPEGSSIVNILSRSAKEALPNLVISNSFRPALAGLAKTLSVELAPHGIRVNNVCPGLVATERQVNLMNFTAEKEGISPDIVRRRSESQIPLGRLASPEEIGSMVAFLCSTEASYITGSTFFVDGGASKSNL